MVTAKRAWRWLSHPPLPPAMNMAVDEALAVGFSKTKIPTLRLYRWACPAVTVGAFQKIGPSLAPLLLNDNVAWVRRITGGQAFLHERDLSYSVTAGTEDPLFSDGIKKTFYSMAKGWFSALRSLGGVVEIYLPPPEQVLGKPLASPRSPFCIASLGPYDIVFSGKKLMGSAQKRWPHHFLQHGSLPLEPASFEKRLHPESAATLCDILPERPSRAALEEAIKMGFETALSIRLEEGSLTSEEERMAHQLAAEKYGNRDWNE